MLALETGVTRPQARACRQPRSWKEQRAGSPREPLGGAQPRRRLGFSLGTLILDFWAPDAERVNVGSSKPWRSWPLVQQLQGPHTRLTDEETESEKLSDFPGSHS